MRCLRDRGTSRRLTLTLLPYPVGFTSAVHSRLGGPAAQVQCVEFHARPTGAGRAEFLVGNPLDPAAIGEDRGGSILGARVGAGSALITALRRAFVAPSG
jgi:hypothetical protein